LPGTKFKNPGESFYIRRAAAAFLLKFEEDGLDYLKKKAKSDNINERIQVAETLGEIPSKQGTSILTEMLNDDDYLDVKKQVISSLGNSNEKTVANILHPLLNDLHPNIREPVVEALANIASPDSFEPLKKVALSTEERISTRKKAINALTKIRKENPIKIYMELLDYDDEIIKSTVLMAIGKVKNPQNLDPGLAKDLKKKLKEQLKQQEDRKKKWRQIRDEDTESYNDQEMQLWRKRLEEVKPREYMEFHVAYALSRMDPQKEGVELLGHHLANVREGALMGFGSNNNVSLLEKLYRLRKESDKPWFRHDAYRTIDDILLNIETFGEKKEFDELKNLFKQLQEKEGKNLHPGVKTRMEWTIDRLRERVSGH
jgi:HEAT repeat protein